MRLRGTAIAFLLGALACIPPAAAAGSDEIVAVVGGEAVSRAAFGRSLVKALGPLALDSAVDWTLIEQEARRRELSVTDEDVDARFQAELALELRSIPQEARMTAAEYWASEEQRGRTRDDARREQERGMSRSAVRARLLGTLMLADRFDTDDETLARYRERSRGAQYSAAHIQVAEREDAVELQRQLSARPELWRQFVYLFTEDRASVAYAGRMPPVPHASEFGEFLSQMQPGELTLCQGYDGWHVVRLLGSSAAGTGDAAVTDDELRAELLARSAEASYLGLLAELRRAAHVVSNLSASPAERECLGADVAAFVNGEPIPVDALADLLIHSFGSAMIWPCVERMLVCQEAERHGVTVSDEELGARMDAIADDLYRRRAAALGLTPARYTEQLTAQGVTEAQARRRLLQEGVDEEDVRATLLAEKLVADLVIVSDTDVEGAYADLHGERWTVREMSCEDLAEARAMQARLRRGVPFDLAAATSTARPGLWVAGATVTTVTSSHPYRPYVERLRPGEVSDVFEQGGQYRIIEVLERSLPSDPPPLASVRDSLVHEVRRRKSRRHVLALLIKLQAEARRDGRLDVRLN